MGLHIYCENQQSVTELDCVYVCELLGRVQPFATP